MLHKINIVRTVPTGTTNISEFLKHSEDKLKMLNMTATVLAVRYGSMENEQTKETFKWAKVTTVDDELEESSGFIGQRVVEYSVPSEHVDDVVANAKHGNCVPSPCDLELLVTMSGGKPTLKCIGLKSAQKLQKQAS